jgi:predicted amino acid-binding ACT domain protein
MSLWTVRVELADRPGRLAALTGAVAACGGNIRSIDVQALDGSRVVDELLVDLPDDASVEDVESQIRATGADVVMLVPADDDDLVDPQTRCLELSRRLVRDHPARLRVFEASLAELVGAESAWVVPTELMTTSPLATRAVQDGVPMMGRERTGLAPTQADQDPPWLLVVPLAAGRPGRVTMLARRLPGFSASEIARVEALVALAAELGLYDADDGRGAGTRRAS